MDSGDELKCTPDHLFMLRNEMYKKAEELLLLAQNEFEKGDYDKSFEYCRPLDYQFSDLDSYSISLSKDKKPKT